MLNKNSLPNNWKLVNLEEIISPRKEKIQPNEIKGQLYLGLEHIISNNLNIINFGSSNDLKSTKGVFYSGDILYGKLRPYLNKVVLSDNRGVCSTDIIVFQVKKELVLAKYIANILRSNSFVSFATMKMSGANLPRVSWLKLKKFKIPLPPLKTQQKIVEILEKAEKLKEWRAEADVLTDEYLKSVFLEMFGDPVGNSKNWNLTKFGKVGTLERGKSKHRPRNAPELLGGNYPLIQTGDVANADGYIRAYNQTYSESGLKQSRMWPSGTLCITIAANIAKTGILTFDACFPDSIVGFKPYKNVRTEYVQFWISFLQKILEKNAPESAQKNINLKILSNLDIPIPPIELQNQFAETVKKVEQLKKHQKQSKQEIDNLFNTLMQKAFKGELTC